MKIKSKVAGLVLALGAAVAPLAGKAKAETTDAPKSVEIAKAEKAQKLKEAIHLGLPREELLKYVDFPEWIPTTEDGKFDSNKAFEMFDKAGLDKSENKKAFLDYATTVEKGENADIAFQKFAKQITNGDAEKMAALNKIKDALQETQKRIPKKDMESNWGWGPLSVGILAAAALMFMSDRFQKVDADKLSKFTALMSGLIVGFVGVGVASNESVYQSYMKISEQIHNAYATQEIQKAANPEIVQMDMKQAKQFIEFAKQNSSVK